jgi:outer membrane protein OmpA-like peptidoglycan-associated protein
MMPVRSLALPALFAASLLVAGCGDGGLLSGGGEGAPVDVQFAHPNGVVVQVKAVRVDGERTAVDLLVMNGREREIRLNQGRENSYLLTDAGEKLLLVAPATNTDLAIPGTRGADLTLVFAGALARSGTATLVLNDSGSADGETTSNPRFQITVPLDDAGGSAPEQSSMANLRPVPATTLGRAAPQGSALGSDLGNGSSLQVVDALKSELGAVDTERGTVVSLPGDVTFDFDKATLRATARPTLARLAQLISQGGAGSVSIEGHTDSRGDDSYNRSLSLARAEAVKAYLVEQGIPADRLRTLGLGETRPAVPNAAADGSDDEAGRQRNRRVEVVLPETITGTGTASGTGTGNAAP